MRTALQEGHHASQRRKRQQRSGVERVALHELLDAHSEDSCFEQQHAEGGRKQLNARWRASHERLIERIPRYRSGNNTRAERRSRAVQRSRRTSKCRRE